MFIQNKKKFFITLIFISLGFSKNCFASSNQNNTKLIKHSLQLGLEGAILKIDNNKLVNNYIYFYLKDSNINLVNKKNKFDIDACLTYLYNVNTSFGFGINAKLGLGDWGRFYLKEKTLDKKNYIHHGGIFFSPSLRFNFNLKKNGLLFDEYSNKIIKGWRNSLYFDLGVCFNFGSFGVEGDKSFISKFFKNHESIIKPKYSEIGKMEFGFSWISPIGFGGNIFFYKAGFVSDNSCKNFYKDLEENRTGIGIGIFYDFWYFLRFFTTLFY